MQKGFGMATPPDASAPPRRSLFRSILPFAIIGVAAAVIVGAWAAPVEMDNLFRVLITEFAILLGILLLCFWLVFFSGWRFWQSIGLLLSAAGAASYGVVGRVSFKGDMVPTFRTIGGS